MPMICKILHMIVSGGRTQEYRERGDADSEALSIGSNMHRTQGRL